MQSVNKVILVGNLGNDPEVRSMQSGDEVCNLSIATSESWKDKHTGEKKEKTEWHRVVIFSQGLVNVVKNYLRKGSKVYIEGQLQTRSWEQDGQKKYTTEIVLKGYGAKLVMLDGRNSSQNNQDDGYSYDREMADKQADEMEDEIPF